MQSFSILNNCNMNMDNTNYTLLLVDDNSLNVELLGEILSQQGYVVGCAYSGYGALEMARTLRPDLIILDIAMPAIDGFEVFSILKSDPDTQDIPVVFVTSLNDGDDMARAMSMGAADYIVKPFNAAIILERIAAHLKNRG